MSDDRFAPVRPAYKMYDHWCEHQGCRRWGSFGFQSRYGTLWFCGDHRRDAEGSSGDAEAVTLARQSDP